MTRLKTIIVLAVFLLLLGGIATWDEWKTNQEEQAKKNKNQLTTIVADKVNDLVYVSNIEEGGAPGSSKPLTVHLVKVDGVWNIKEPIKTEADGGAVDNLIKTILDYNYAAVMSSDKKDWAKFGLINPDHTVTMKTIGGDSETFYFGAKAPVGYNSYLATSESDDVLMGSQHITPAVTKSLFDLRDKSLFHIDETKLTGMTYKNKNGTEVAMIKEKGVYQFSDGDGQPDGAYIRDYIDDVNFVRVEKFDDHPDADLVSKLNDPEVVMTFTGATNLKAAFVASNDKIYAKVDGDATVYELPADFSKKIMKRKTDFHNRRIVDGTWMTATSSVTVDGDHYEKVNGNWYGGAEIEKAKGAKNGEGAQESASIRAFMVDLEFAKTDDFYPMTQPDFLKSAEKAPIHRIILDVAGDQPKTVKIELYKHEQLDDKYWVKVDGAPSAYLVGKSNFASIEPDAAPGKNSEGKSPEG